MQTEKRLQGENGLVGREGWGEAERVGERGCRLLIQEEVCKDLVYPFLFFIFIVLLRRRN